VQVSEHVDDHVGARTRQQRDSESAARVFFEGDDSLLKICDLAAVPSEPERESAVRRERSGTDGHDPGGGTRFRVHGRNPNGEPERARGNRHRVGIRDAAAHDAASIFRRQIAEGGKETSLTADETRRTELPLQTRIHEPAWNNLLKDHRLARRERNR